MELFKLVGKIAIDNKGANSELTKTTGLAKKSSSGMVSSFKKIGVAVGGAFAVKKIVDFGKASVDAYNIQKEAEVKLETVMKQRMGATDKSIQSIKDLASEQQKLGVIGDEVQLAGAQQLSTFLKSEESLKKLIPAMNNLTAQQKGMNATSTDTINIGNLMGKVMQGQIGALTRVGITFTKAQEEVLKYGTEQEKAAVLAEVITDNVGNMNEELAKTDAGKMKQAQNDFGDFQETLGELLMPVLRTSAKLLQGFAQVMITHVVPAIKNIVAYVTEKFAPAFEKIWGAIQKVLGIIIKFFADLFEQNKELITTLVDVISELVTTIVDTLAPVFDFVIKAIEPLIKIIMIYLVGAFKQIMYFVNLIVALFKGDFSGAFDMVKKMAENWVNIMSNILSGVIDYIVGLGSKVFKAALDFGGKIAKGIWDGVKWVFETVRQKFDETINMLSGGLLGQRANTLRLTPEAQKTLDDINAGRISTKPKTQRTAPRGRLGAEMYSRGAVLTKPTVFGYNPYTNKKMIGGETGAEAIAPISTLKKYIKEAVADREINGRITIRLEDNKGDLVQTIESTIKDLVEREARLTYV